MLLYFMEKYGKSSLNYPCLPLFIWSIDYIVHIQLCQTEEGQNLKFYANLDLLSHSIHNMEAVILVSY